MMIRKIVKDEVWARQKGGCANCIAQGREYYSKSTDNATYYNTVLLCPQCYNRRKDLDLLLSIYEYLYYIRYGKVLEDINELKDFVRSLTCIYI